MNATINISLPKDMYKDIKKWVSDHKYSSVSEYFRDLARKSLYRKRITENGFTEEFEDAVLESAKEPIEDAYALETEEDIHNYFKYHKLPPKKK